MQRGGRVAGVGSWVWGSWWALWTTPPDAEFAQLACLWVWRFVAASVAGASFAALVLVCAYAFAYGRFG